MEKKRLKKLIKQVINPRPGEKVLVLTDRPIKGKPAIPMWKWRRKAALEWLAAFRELGKEEGFEVKPLLEYQATYRKNSSFPEKGLMDGAEVDIRKQLEDSDIYVSLPEYSASRSLLLAAKSRKPKMARVVSMPGVGPEMERAMLADYEKIGRNCKIIGERLEKAIGAEIEFSTGHKLYVDLRDRPVYVDDGKCHEPTEKKPGINFPSGEDAKAPYEGTEGDTLGKSMTEGEMPIYDRKSREIVVCTLRENRVVDVAGSSKYAEGLRKHFAKVKNSNNLAEFAFGLNEGASGLDEVPFIGKLRWLPYYLGKLLSRQGAYSIDPPREPGEIDILEMEKAIKSIHLALGASIHFGGKVDADVHQDYVYTSKTKIKPTVNLVYENGAKEKIMENGIYTISLA